MILLITLCQAFFKWVPWVTFELWEFTKKHRLLIWAVVLQAAYLVWKILSDPLAFLVDVLAFFTQADFAWLGQLGMPDGVTNMLAFANHFFPLDTLCAYSVAYWLLLLQVTIYRVVKSMIPSPLPGGGGT